MLASCECGLDERRLREDGQRDDDGVDVGAGEEVGVGLACAAVVGVERDIVAGCGSKGAGGGGGAGVDRFEGQEGRCLDGGLEARC